MAVRQPWFRSQAAWAFIALRYVPALAILNTGWEYSALMPVVRFLGLEIGLSRLLQWMVIPPLALWLAKVAPCARNAPSPRA